MADPTTVTCPHCGAMNPAEDAYCSSCHRLISERADDLGLDGFPQGPPGGAVASPTRNADRVFRAPITTVNVLDLRCQACGAPMKAVPGAMSVECAYCGATLVLYAPPTPPAPVTDLTEGADDDPDDGPGVWGGYQWTTHQWGPGTPLLFGIALALLGVAVELLNATSQTCTTSSGVTQCVSHAQSTVAALGWLLLIAGGIVAAVGAVLLWNARAASGSDRAS